MGYYDEEKIKQRTSPDASIPYYLTRGYIDPKDSVLDIGCGNGRNVTWLLRNGIKKVLGIDKNLKADMTGIGKEIYEDLPIIEGDMARTPLLDDEFDVILLNSVLHFSQIPERYDPDKPLPLLSYVLDEMERITIPRARIIVSEYSNQSTHPDFRRYIDELGCITAEDIKDEFERRGYKRLDIKGPVSYGGTVPDDTNSEGILFLWFAYRMGGG